MVSTSASGSSPVAADGGGLGRFGVRRFGLAGCGGRWLLSGNQQSAQFVEAGDQEQRCDVVDQFGQPNALLG